MLRYAMVTRMNDQFVKRPFEFPVAFDRIREAIASYPRAAMFALADAGFATPFQQLVACVLSIRTRDEVSLPASLRLFGRASDPQSIAELPVEEIDALIPDVTFHERKAAQIQAMARIGRDDLGGSLPCDDEIMRGFAGVGPKCANLALGIACGLPRISVDIHVHRVTNRWGIVMTKTPEQTEAALRAILPDEYAVTINELLVPFGKHICTGVAPRCSTCPVLEMCQQVGVTTHR
jgi:endonuclease-3